MSDVPRLLRGLALVALVLWGLAPRPHAGSFLNSAHGKGSLLPLGCGSCHVGHGVSNSRMMPNPVNSMCYQCHSDETARGAARAKGLLVGGDTLANISTEFSKTSRHPLDLTGGTASRPVYRPGTTLQSVPSRLVCSDCHDAHYLVKGEAWNPGGSQVKQIGNARHGPSREYSLCYRCHGTSANTGVDIQRLFRNSNPSYHPVEAIGRNNDVPSLIQPYTTQSIIACTDCHGSDNTSGPRGPHGSSFSPILRAHYETDSGHAESAYQYALCYRCHSRSVLLDDSRTAFKEHKKHIEGAAKASCYACHNSHGGTQYSHLIDFDTRVVFPNRKNQLNFQDLGSRSGSCSLKCHNNDHDEKRYGAGGG